MPLRRNKYAKIYRFTNKDDEWSEQYQDIDEYIARKCEDEKIDYRTLQMNDRLRLAKKYGCHREFVDSIYRIKHKF